MRRKVRASILALLLGTLFVSGAWRLYQDAQPVPVRTYSLTRLAEAHTPMGITILIPTESLLVKNVRHEPSGAICFDQVEKDGSGCIKSTHIFLIERNIK